MILAIHTIESPTEHYGDATVHDGGWRVVVFDNDYNTVDEVIRILMLATSCPFEEAWTETWEIHHLGKSVVHYADEAECRRVATIIAKINIQVVVEKEP